MPLLPGLLIVMGVISVASLVLDSLRAQPAPPAPPAPPPAPTPPPAAMEKRIAEIESRVDAHAAYLAALPDADGDHAD